MLKGEAITMERRLEIKVGPPWRGSQQNCEREIGIAPVPGRLVWDKCSPRVLQQDYMIVTIGAQPWVNGRDNTRFQGGASGLSSPLNEPFIELDHNKKR